MNFAIVSKLRREVAWRILPQKDKDKAILGDEPIAAFNTWLEENFPGLNGVVTLSLAWRSHKLSDMVSARNPVLEKLRKYKLDPYEHSIVVKIPFETNEGETNEKETN